MVRICPSSSLENLTLPPLSFLSSSRCSYILIHSFSCNTCSNSPKQIHISFFSHQNVCMCLLTKKTFSSEKLRLCSEMTPLVHCPPDWFTFHIALTIPPSHGEKRNHIANKKQQQRHLIRLHISCGLQSMCPLYLVLPHTQGSAFSIR